MKLKPIKGQEWIEKFRKNEFWINKKRSYPQNIYSRLTKSYLGWWFYFQVRKQWPLAGLLIDPLSSGGLYSHINCFIQNALVIRVWYRGKRSIWKLFHRKQWQQERRFMDATMQATIEGFADKMANPTGLDGNFHVSILGERYFLRVKEILDGDSSNIKKP